MKKIFALLLVFATLAAFAGCGDTSGSDETEGQGGSKATSNEGGGNPSSGNETITSITEADVRSHKAASESDFTWVEVIGGVKITDYIGSDKIVVIPDSISGQPVVAISALTFGNDSQVRGVYIPTSVTELTGTFTNNSAIEVVICEGVEVIGISTFNCCAVLHTVVLGDNLTELGRAAFGLCTMLKELYIAPSLKEISSEYALSVFLMCYELTIRGEAGSYIETFCSEYDIKFEAK